MFTLLRISLIIFVLSIPELAFSVEEKQTPNPGLNEATLEGLEWRSIGPAMTAGRIAGAAALLLVVSATVFALRRKRYLTVGWLWFVGMLVPVIGGVIWKRGTRTGALAAAAAGSAVALLGLTTDLDIAGFPTEVYSALVSALVFVVVSLSTEPRR